MPPWARCRACMGVAARLRNLQSHVISVRNIKHLDAGKPVKELT